MVLLWIEIFKLPNALFFLKHCSLDPCLATEVCQDQIHPRYCDMDHYAYMCFHYCVCLLQLSIAMLSFREKKLTILQL